MKRLRDSFNELPLSGKALAILGLALAVLLVLSLIPIPFVDNRLLHVSFDLYAPYGIAVVVVWFFFLVDAIFLMLRRVWRLWRKGKEIPSLLWRDMASKFGLAISLSLPLVIRFMDATAGTQPIREVATYLPYLLWSTLPALLGMGTFFFFEVYVIGPADEVPLPLPV